MHWNSEFTLPPVDCPLLILMGEEAVRVKRPTFVETRSDELVFIREDTSEKVFGRFRWTYP